MRIVGGPIVTMDPRRRVIANGTVRIERDRIVGVEPGEAPAQGAERVIDARGHAVLPGLINAHTHIASNILARGLLDELRLFEWLQTLWRLKVHLDADDLYAASTVGIAEMLLSGTTCFNELFDGYDPLPGIAAMQDLGVRAVAGWCLADGGVYADTAEQSWRDVARMPELKQRHHGSADGRIHLAIAPHAPYTVSKELGRAAREAADAGGLRIHTHLAEGEQEVAFIRERFGQTPVEYFMDCGLLGPDLIAAHCCQFQQADIDAYARTGASIAHCPVCNTRNQKGYLPLPAVRRAGIPVGLATDGPASNNSLDLFAEAKFAAVLHRFVTQDIGALSARGALELATIGAARAMGLDRDLGSLEPGKKADVVLVDLRDPRVAPVHDVYSTLVYASSGARVDTVIVDGRVLVEDSRVTGLDLRASVAELNERATSLVRRGLPEHRSPEMGLIWR